MAAKPKASITEELRKGLNSELRVKKIDTADRGGLASLETSANGTRLDNRRTSIDRTMTNNTAHHHNE